MNFHAKPTTFVSNVKIKVQDLRRALRFYTDMLGFDILEKTPSTAKLTADGKTSFLQLEQPENVIPKQRRTTGLYHFAILLPTAKDLANVVIHLANHNISFGSADHLVSEAIYLQDPDGNEIEIYRDRDPKEWKWDGDQVEMATIPLNLERLLQQASRETTWKMPKDALLGHIHLHVSELFKTEQFYVEGLGMDVVNRFGPQALFLSYGKYHHHVGVNTWNGIGAPRPAKNSVGLKSFTLLFDNERVRERVIDNLKKIGATVSEENGQFITHDPSGNCIELAV